MSMRQAGRLSVPFSLSTTDACDRVDIDLPLADGVRGSDAA